MPRVDDGNDLTGRPVAAAVDAVLSDRDADRETVRTTLDRVIEDGVVTVAAFEEALDETAKVLSTAETRMELAVSELEDARDAAAPVADHPIVAHRLDGRAADLSAAEADLDAVQATLAGVIARDGDVTYEAVRDLRAVYTEATSVQNRADQLQVALEAFQQWVTDPEERAASLQEDVSDLETSVDALADEAAVVGAGDGDAWADVAIQRAALSLLRADLQAELAALRAWPGAPDDGPDRDAVAERLTTLTDRLDDVDGTLADACEPAWRDRYGRAVATVERSLSRTDPPVDWAAVQTVLEKHRPNDVQTDRT